MNLIWQPIFFGLLKPVPATADIIALLGTTSYLTYVWSSVDDVATYLMFPYLGWLGFATYLSVRQSIKLEQYTLIQDAGRMWLPEQLGLQKAKGRSAKAELETSAAALSDQQ